MNRASHQRTTAAQVAAAIVLLAWWAPTLALHLAPILAGCIRSLAISALADLLVTFGRRDAARAVLVAELRRCERRMDAMGLQRRRRAP